MKTLLAILMVVSFLSVSAPVFSAENQQLPDELASAGFVSLPDAESEKFQGEFGLDEFIIFTLLSAPAVTTWVNGHVVNFNYNQAVRDLRAKHNIGNMQLIKHHIQHVKRRIYYMNLVGSVLYAFFPR